MGAGRPMNFDLRDFSGAEAEVQALVARGNVASGGGRESYLAIHQHARAKPIAIAACSTQGDGKPMPRAAMIHKHERLSAKRGNHNIHPALFRSPKAAPRPAIAEVIPESARSKRPLRLSASSGGSL